jgi:putative endonuclease
MRWLLDCARSITGLLFERSEAKSRTFLTSASFVFLEEASRLRSKHITSGTSRLRSKYKTFIVRAKRSEVENLPLDSGWPVVVVVRPMTLWKWYVYIIECADGLYYTGMTWNPAIRFEQHLSKLGSKFTGRHGVKRLAYLEEHEDLYVARARERQIKDWSRAKKEKLIAGAWGKEW